MTDFSTRAIHAGQEPDPQTGAVVPPITLSTTFRQPEVGVLPAGFDYGRSGNPTRQSLERLIASLENGKYGHAFASGLAAEDAVLRMLNPGDHIVIPHDAYGGSFRLISKVHARYGIEFTPVNAHDPAALRAAITDKTRMVWVETPTNPTLSIVDIAAVAEIARSHNALTVVDNTFATPYLQQPLGLGADIVLHSSTKYLGGHSDVVGGLTVTSSDEVAEKIGFVQNAAGAVPGPLDCYLTIRGIKTLSVRMDRHVQNAEAIVELLAAHPAVSEVLYPGLSSHPGHDVAARQMSAFGGMVSFLAAGGEQAALDIVRHTELFTLAESLGAVESLIEHPGRMTHASAAGSPLEVSSALVRLSVGIEGIDDLTADLLQALDRV